MTRWTLLVVALMAVMSLDTGSSAVASSSYQFVDIGDLGGHYTVPEAIAPNDTTVVGVSDSDQNRQGFLWTAAGGMENELPGSSDGFLLAINSSDVATGQATPDAGSVGHAVRYVPGGPREDLAGIGTGPSQGRDINDSGQVAGWGLTSPTAREHAVLWDSDGTPTDLGMLGPNDNGSMALFVDNAGEVFGRDNLPIAPHAFIWTKTAGMVDLNPLAGLASDVGTSPVFVNEAGQVLLDTDAPADRLYTPGHGTVTVKTPNGTDGVSYRALGQAGQVVGQYIDAGNTYRPFEWQPGSGAVDIPIPAGYSGIATDINSAGVAAGVYHSPDDSYGAFEWSAAGGYVDLGALPDGLSFWGDGTLINDAGTVVATGFDSDGFAHTFVRMLVDDSTDTTAPTVTSSNSSAAYTIGDSVTADYSCDDESGGSGVASCVGTVAEGDQLDTSTAGAFSYDVTATDNAANQETTTISYTVLPSDSVSQQVDPGGSATTDTGAPGPSADDPVATSVTTPDGGPVTIQEGVSGAPPTGFDAIGQAIQISAPGATVDDPLLVSISIDRSLLPAGTDETNAEVFRDGVQALPCTGPGAAPDPCVESRTRTPVSDDFAYITLTVRTSHASTWTTAVRSSSFAFSGFFAPIKTTKLNVLPAGSGLRIVFSLGGDQGLAVLQGGAPQVAEEACPAMRVNAVAKLASAKRSHLVYRPANGRYIYIWKTPASPGCYVVTLALSDGSSHTFHVQLT